MATLLRQGAVALLEGSWDLDSAATFRLFATDVYSDLATAAELAQLTDADMVEPTFVGYSAVAAGAWVLTTGADGVTTATHPEISFTAMTAPAPPQTIHGWWLERDSDGKAVMLDVLVDGPFVTAAPATLRTTPTLTLD